MQKTFTNDDVTIRDVPPTPVAIMEHRGNPATIGATVQRFIAWRKAAGLHPKTSPTFNVWRSERRPASPADYSVDLCVGTDQPIEADGDEIKAGEIPGGRCAVLRVVGNTDNLEPAALYLYRDWLPASGEEARDFPVYCQRLSFFPEVPEHEAVAELFLPLKQRPLTVACLFRSPAALYLYRDWLPASGEEARDFPIYCQRLNLFPEVPAHESEIGRAHV